MILLSWYVVAFGLVALLGLGLVERIRSNDKSSTDADRVARAGTFVGLLIVLASSLREGIDEPDSFSEIASVCGFASLGAVLTILCASLGKRILFAGNAKEALARNSTAVGIALACHDIAMGILVSKAIVGSSLVDFGMAACFFGLAIVAHQLITLLFRAYTTYDDDEQILGGNVAAALSYGGLSIGVAVVIARALEGEVDSFREAFTGFSLLCLSAALFIPARQVLVQSIMLGAPMRLRGGKLDDEIGLDRNVSIAALEAASYIGLGLAIFALA